MTIRAATDDPTGSQVAEVTNPAGAGDFLIVCEHASNFIPASFAGLGLEGAALESHIAWEPRRAGGGANHVRAAGRAADRAAIFKASL
jgi:predicted N-formylglutamate amidohydrolase